MELDSRQTIVVAILVLFLGKYLNKKFKILRKYNIPEPVTGGLMASLFFGLLYLAFNLNLSFATHYRDVLLIVFFTAIGLSTEIRSIIKGGKVLLIISIFAIAYIFFQNYLSISIAKLFGLNPGTGLLSGSIALQGGHGNVVSWIPVINEQFDIGNPMEIGMTMATFGLIIGGVFGGPVAKYLIKKHNLKPDIEENKDNIIIGAMHGQNLSIDYISLLKVLFMLAISIGIGIYLHNLLEYLNFTLPMFATCMLGGVIIANSIPLIIPKLKCPAKSPTLAITSDLSLGLFLAMAMMSLKFWEIGEESLFIIVSIVVQTISVILFSVFVLFRVLGKNYASAVISAGYVGSSMGATPTAMANMASVTKEYGPSAIAFAVIPILGAFIIQVSNAFVINIILMLTN
ncbi:MAG: sodium/glutamate symporter [Bacteroidetes bacterium]|nr:MAG: sodium/glutamate symporter [Bacteroidota bacterium]